ncbi:MAG: C4-dicarboxylate TRAP transporter substrate-binding protein [Proteobacteria bacterium]|nr:C4-dicarboxylate TRAP transporter substrate-binding protein [Pseudomonadota bacterium]
MTCIKSFKVAVWGTSLAAFVAVLGLPGQAAAAETIKLTAIDGYPPKAMWVDRFIKFFIPEIDKGLAKTGKYKIEWNQAWSGQIAKPKNVLQAIQKGLGDIGVVTTVFHGSRVPLQMIAYATPFVTTDPGLVSRTVDDLVAKYPAFNQAWDKYNQVYLTNLAVLDTYQMFFKEPVKNIDDFKGKKIGVAGMNALYMKGAGAATVGGSYVTYYNKVKTGVLDGFMLWPEAVTAFKMQEVAPYMLRADIGTVNSKAITVNADTWKKLPAEVKKVIKDAAIKYRDHVAKTALAKAKSSYAEYKAKGGTIFTMSKEERRSWARSMPNVAKEWAAGLEEKGIPAKAILASYMETMRDANQKILRQWDKE